MKLNDLQNKSIVILGLGREGVSTLQFLRNRFPNKLLAIADRLTLSELPKKIRDLITQDKYLIIHLGPAYLTDCQDYQVLIKSPGISPYTKDFQRVLEKDLLLTSQTELFLENYPGKVVGVTGTKGKSTTASLIYHLLLRAGFGVQLGGNIGLPPLELLAKKSDWVVLEMSSHQLWNLTKSPHIAVFLNIYPEHLDYSDFDEYLESKQNIARFQTADDYFVFNANSQPLVDFASSLQSQKYTFGVRTEYPGSFVNNDQVCFNANPNLSFPRHAFRQAGKRESIQMDPRVKPEDDKVFKEILFPCSDIPLKGPANLNNVQAAVVVAKILSVANELIAKGVQTFTPLPGRLETVGTHQGITFVDDCLSTIPEATLNALHTFDGTVGAIFLGGHERKQDYTQVIKEVIKQRIPLVILFPTTGTRIKSSLEKNGYGGKIITAVDMKDAVAAVYQLTPPNLVALFSAGAPSFGLFKDYQDRSQQFRHWVQKLGK